MDTTQLKYFISVAQTLSFSEAARRCGVSQPTISHGINELEKQLEAVLFLRSRQGVIITEVGQELLPRAMEMVELEEKTVFQIRQAEKGIHGSISISALTTSCTALSKCLTVFAQKYPDIMIDINFTSGRSQVLAMNEQRYDFHFAVREMVPAGNNFESIVSHTDHLCVAFPANHPLADQPLDFSKLKNERFIDTSETDGPGLYEEIHRVCRAHDYQPNVVCKYDRAEAVLLSVGAGTGISIIPEALRWVFYSENVKFVPIPDPDSVRTYVVAWHKDLTNPSAKRFLEVVKDLFSAG